MPLPRAVARFNKRFTNRFIEPIVRLFPGYIVVEHQGRSSGATYRTPVYAFETDDGTLLVALTYGVGADWAQNVLAGGGVVHRNGTETTISSAESVDAHLAQPHLPGWVRLALRVLRIDTFFALQPFVPPGRCRGKR